jgi:hypothetical protein
MNIFVKLMENNLNLYKIIIPALNLTLSFITIKYIYGGALWKTRRD